MVLDEDEASLKQVVIYTDGACFGNPGPGGYGVVLLYGKHVKELAGGFALTTNNRMEIMAVIVGLTALKTRCRVTVYSDSQYLVRAMAEGWVRRWQAQGWWRTRTTRASNADLWAQLLALCAQHCVEFAWVKGHAGHPENERCDTLSRQALRQAPLPPDDGYVVAQATSSHTQMRIEQAGQVLPSPAAPHPPAAKTKITWEGQPCRKCGTPVIKKVPRSRPQASQSYTYDYYFFCPGCTAMYMVEAAKQMGTPAPRQPTLRPKTDSGSSQNTAE